LLGALRRLAGARGRAGRALAALRSFGAGRTVAQVLPCTPGLAFAALGAFSPVKAVAALRSFGAGRTIAQVWSCTPGWASGAFGAFSPVRAVAALGTLAAV
jgi:hypothetical protein